MQQSGTQRTRVATSAGRAGVLAAVGGVLLLMAAALGLLTLVELIARYGFREPLYSFSLAGEVGSYLGLGIAVISLLALPAALAAPFVRVGDPPLRSHSALALVPGCMLALAVALISIAATIATSFEAALSLISASASSFGEYTLTFPLVMALSAIMGGARTPEATAAIAAPTLLATLISVPVAMSGAPFLAVFDVAMLAAAPIACAATAVLYAIAPARAVTPWLLGWVLLFAFALSMVAGLFTQTETAGLLATFAIVIALPVRRLALRQPLAPLLRQLGMETVAITSCLAAAACVYTPLSESGIADALVRAAGSGFAMVVLLAAGYFALAYLVTPFLTLALLLSVFVFPLLQGAGLDSASAGALLLLLGTAAAIARAGRTRAEAPGLSLSPTSAWTAAALLAVLAVATALVLRTVMPSLPALVR